MHEIPDIVLYDSFGCFIISLKYALVRRSELINTNNKNINGEKDTNIPIMILENESFVLKLESFNTNNIKVATDTEIDMNANILPITELDENELRVIIRIVIPPAIRE